MARERDEDFTDEPRRRRRDDPEDEPRRRRRDEDEEGYAEAPRARRRQDDDDYDDEPRPRRRQREDDDDHDDRPRRRRRIDDGAPRMSREDLRTVARSQRAICLCILGYLATIPLRFAINALPDQQMQLVLALCLLLFYVAVAITATVFVFMMALKVYSTGVGITLGILTMFPCIGLIVLLIINAKATGILRQYGVRVGLLGANMSDLR
jgi:hypothetical protein